jgi:hypothetical protein
MEEALAWYEGALRGSAGIVATHFVEWQGKPVKSDRMAIRSSTSSKESFIGWRSGAERPTSDRHQRSRQRRLIVQASALVERIAVEYTADARSGQKHISTGDDPVGPNPLHIRSSQIHLNFGHDSVERLDFLTQAPR